MKMNDTIYEQKMYNPYIKIERYVEVRDAVNKLYPDTRILNTKSPKRVRRHIIMYVVNILTSDGGVIAVSRSNSYITGLKSKWHSYRYADKALDLMIEDEIVDYQEGQNSIAFVKGFASRLYRNSKFDKHFGKQETYQPEINEEEISDVDLSDDSNILLAIGSHYIESTERKVKYLNDNYFNKMYLTHTTIEKPIFLGNVKLTRIYKQDGCGRFFQKFGTSYQTITKETRQGVLINDKETAEMDYSGMHINLLYNRVGLSSPFSDNYIPVIRELGVQTDELRKIIKHCIFVMINAKSYKSYVVSFNKKESKRAMVKSLRSAEIGLKDVYEAFCKVHEPIAQFINTNASIGLMLEESNIMQNVLFELMKRDINAIPLHDSVIFEKGNDEVVKSVMESEYFKQTGFKINAEYKNTNTSIRNTILE